MSIKTGTRPMGKKKTKAWVENGQGNSFKQSWHKSIGVRGGMAGLAQMLSRIEQLYSGVQKSESITKICLFSSFIENEHKCFTHVVFVIQECHKTLIQM
ncbi:hypothetical protein AAFF_G00220970 [Aldrovandia affinis]|uniref:Uncharacterized protein n=1 Tax=Aldrovandia affinis TaxID=143900 RepID=A0AAD7W4F4_9TELE|nr:hypothetical protein AAFF_G00220970 [Aldrovandia affinis]